MRRARNAQTPQFTPEPVRRVRTEHEALRDAIYKLADILPDIDFASAAPPATILGTYFAAIPADIRRYILAPLMPYRKTKEWMLSQMAAESITDEDLDALRGAVSPPASIRVMYIGAYTVFLDHSRVHILHNSAEIYNGDIGWRSDMYYVGNNIVCFYAHTSGTHCIDLENPRRTVNCNIGKVVSVSLLPCGLLLDNETRRLHNVRTGQSRDLPELRSIGLKTTAYGQIYVDDYGSTFKIAGALKMTKSPLRCEAISRSWSS